MWLFRSDKDTFCRATHSQDCPGRKPEAGMSQQGKCELPWQASLPIHALLRFENNFCPNTLHTAKILFPPPENRRPTGAWSAGSRSCTQSKSCCLGAVDHPRPPTGAVKDPSGASRTETKNHKPEYLRTIKPSLWLR